MNRACPVCGQTRSQLLYRPPESPGPISRCDNCAMVYVSELEDTHALIFDGPVLYPGNPPDVVTNADLDSLVNAPEFGMLPEKEREAPALRRNADDALDRLARLLGQLPHPPAILDIGSGFGFFLAAAKERGWHTQGLEPLSPSAVYARATFGLDILCDTLRDDSFAPDQFDIVTSFQVFEHLPDPRADALRLSHFVRPGGLILIEVPNIATPAVRILGERHRHFVQDHLNFFSRDTLGRLLTSVGFTPVAAYYPWRRMTIGHFVERWSHKVLPGSAARSVARSSSALHLSDRIVSLNVRDIVVVIGRRCRAS